MRIRRWLVLLLCAAPSLSACSSGSIGDSDGARGSGASGDGASDGDASGSSDDAASGASTGAGGAAGTSGSGGDVNATSTSASGGPSDDPYAADRELCVAHINELRATKGLPPFLRWVEGEACADLQVEDDSKTMIPHNAWKTNLFGCDGGSSTNECPGWGGPPCIDAMWGESNLPDCWNCDNCPGDYGCDGCDFYGSVTGTVCGHYENLSAQSYTLVACGFGGGWMQLNFK